MNEKGYVKITFEDVKIAQNFFENEKHLDEFLSQVCRYYIGFETDFKYKNVKKFFETYKKVMDRVISSRATGSIGGNKRANNQQVKGDTLEGVLEGVLEVPLEGVLQPKERKEIYKETNKDLLKKSLMKSFDTSGCSEEFILSYNIAEAFRKKFIKIIEDKGGSKTELENAKVDAWVKPIILLQKTDKVSIEKIREVYKEFGNLDFWPGVISSTSGVRKNFNKIVMAISKLKPNQKSISNEMTPQDKNKLIRQQMGI